MEQDNIKNYAVAAFRYYGHISDISGVPPEDGDTIDAVISVRRHLRVEGDAETITLIDKVYGSLPNGRLHRNVITHRVNAAAEEMNMDARTVWRKLARARRLFFAYYIH